MTEHDDITIETHTNKGRYTFILKVSGRPEEDGHVRLSTFINLLDAAKLLVKRADEAANGGKTAYARVVGLALASPATVTIELIPVNPKDDRRRNLFEKVAVARRVQEESYRPSPEEWPVIEALEALAAPVGRDVEAASVTFGDNVVQLSPRLNQRIAELLASGLTCYGSVDGALEQLNLHLNANVFTIYPLVGPRKVQCHFSRELLDDVIGAIGQRVRVTGALRYKPEADFPSEMIVEAIEKLPPDHELPRLADLEGKAPGATGGLLSEEFIGAIRDEWE
ncbi:MAG: hypothetical protein JXA57_17410 [Armatimonadetes bacterium]|nr:hypothetical protein [Armatimonadota bacterium]